MMFSVWVGHLSFETGRLSWVARASAESINTRSSTGLAAAEDEESEACRFYSAVSRGHLREIAKRTQLRGMKNKYTMSEDALVSLLLDLWSKSKGPFLSWNSPVASLPKGSSEGSDEPGPLPLTHVVSAYVMGWSSAVSQRRTSVHDTQQQFGGDHAVFVAE